MARPQYEFDWQGIVDEQHDQRHPASTRHRLRWILGIYGATLAIVLGRAVQSEFSGGEDFRRWAARPLEMTVTLPAARGRILARDGTLLAADQPARAISLHYRYLESPPDPRWLRSRARLRLTRAQRRDPQHLAEAERRVRGEVADLHHRLAALCQLSDAAWHERTGRIQRRVTALVENVNRRRLERYSEQTSGESDDRELGLKAVVAGLFAPPERLPPAEVIVAEQTAYHQVVDDVPAEVAEAIEDHADAFPGVRIVAYTRRTYPLESVAANVVGHVSRREQATDADETEPASETTAGRMGIERQCDGTLRGRPGRERHWTDRRGDVLSVQTERAPVPGRDVVLTLDADLQRFAEQLLDRVAQRAARQPAEAGQPPRGGAIVVLDVHSGEILTAAAFPRFDPNWFAGGDARVEAVLADPRQPLFDRATRMAIPPGSVFKPLTALALVEHGVVDPQKPFACQGYLDDPESMRCQIFRHQGVGHGDVTLADALAQSCNVYFFHHAAELGAAPLVDWARRFGFGQPGAIDWPDAAGLLPDASALRQTSLLQSFAIGQGAFTATPLQVVRMYAAIANGGYLVAPRFTRDAAERPSTPNDPASAGQLLLESRIVGLDDAALAAVREGLRRVVDDPSGTAFETVHLPTLPIAGKTGTAESGGGQADHAWFAGYVPADAPRCAFVVVLEHGGSGSSAAGSIARNLVRRMQQLGYFPNAVTADKEFPPGKG